MHVYILRDDLGETEWKTKLHKAMDRMYDKATELHGLTSGEHGIGSEKKPYLEKAMGEEYMAVLKSIKAAFDPKNILNPGKVC